MLRFSLSDFRRKYPHADDLHRKSINRCRADDKNRNYQRNSSSCHAAVGVAKKHFSSIHALSVTPQCGSRLFPGVRIVVILSPEWKRRACSVFKRDAVDCSDAMRNRVVSAQSQSPLRRCIFLLDLGFFPLPIPPTVTLAGFSGLNNFSGCLWRTPKLKANLCCYLKEEKESKYKKKKWMRSVVHKECGDVNLWMERKEGCRMKELFKEL